jgi:hypothetical protein
VESPLRAAAEETYATDAVRNIGHRERAACPVQHVLAAFLVLGATKIGQHILKAPAGIAELPPMIEVRRLTADVEQPID